jgi:hypothetical protein
MKLSIKTTVMIFSCFLLTIIYHFFFKINNDQSENWEPVHSQSFQEQSIIRSDNSDKNKMFDHSSDPIDSHKAALKKNHGFRSNKSTSSQNLENSVTQDLTPIKPPDKETMKQIGITCDSIIKKHAGQLDPEFNKLISGYEIPDENWENILALYSNIKDSSNDQELSLKARSLLDMAATKVMKRDYVRAKQAYEAILNLFPDTEEAQKALKGIKQLSDK